MRIDGENIKHIFPNFGLYYFKPKKGREQIEFTINDFYIHEILTDLNYQIKSGCSARKVLDFLPKELRHYWWLGFFNGDGCMYYNKDKCGARGMTISSTYNQNWDFFTDLSKEIDFKFYYNKRIDKRGYSWSTVKIWHKDSIKNFYSYIYQDYQEKDFGFLRKKLKFDSFLMDN